MDIFLSTASLKALRAIAAVSPSGTPAGFLLGHVRSGRYFVENAVAGTNANWAKVETYVRLDAVEPGRIIGFFVFSHDAAERRKVGRPHACGKIVLAAAKKRAGEFDFEGFHVDYTGRFVFDPLPVIREKEIAP